MALDRDVEDGESTSIWRERLSGKRRCPNCDFELPDPPLKADPDKLFLFGFLFVAIGIAAGLEYSEGYGPHIFVFQIFLGAGIIAWSIFRYRELRKRHRRSRRHRTTPSLVDVLAKANTSTPLNPIVPPKRSEPKEAQSAPSEG